MKVGIVTKWFNRGQAFVSRYVRDALDEVGHETFILARPTKDKGPMAAHVDRTGVWDQPGVTEASDWEVPVEEYERWIEANGIDVVHWDNCYQHAEIAQLRKAGVKTIGRFVWEMFSPEDAAPAKEAYDVLYSMTRCEQARYKELGIDSPYVQWGLHPELLEAAEDARQRATTDAGRRVHDFPSSSTPSSGGSGREAEHFPGSNIVRFYFPGALLGPRKPHKEVVEAFTAARGDNLRLIFKAQLERRMNYLERAAAEDPRIELVIDDMPTEEHLRLFAGCDVCLGPSRWEGLGLFLYEAVAFGMPQITNDSAPMNEVVVDDVNGILIPDHHDGDAPSGVPSMRPDVPAMTAAIERLADPDERARLADGARSSRAELAWERTVADYASLIERAAS
ncbi:MAG: glycosyltransferase family 4 protein [Solirubrobacterales bacterium]|nr:glycosyltransferase family 4 protein [Solirubrobacterales bacterium]